MRHRFPWGGTLGRSAPASIHPLLDGAWSGTRLDALAALPQAVVLADREGRIVFANAAADAILGRVRRGAGIDDYSSMHGIFTLEGRPFPTTDLPLSRAILRRETTHDVVMKVRRSDGESAWISVSGQPLLDKDGALVGGVVLFEAVTEEPRAAQPARTVLSRSSGTSLRRSRLLSSP